MDRTACLKPRVWRHAISNPLDPIGSRVTESVEWHHGMRLCEIAEPQPGVLLYHNGIRVDAADRQLDANDHVIVVLQPQLEAAFAWLVDYIISAIIAYAIGTIIGKLIAPPQDDARRPPEDNESATYGWSGLRTNYTSNGMAIPVVLGEHDVGGLVIGQNVETILAYDGTGAVIDQQSRLSLLLLLCHGPVASIGGLTADADDLTGTALPAGLKINGNSAENFDGVRAWIRTGGLNQTAIPIFAALRVFNAVGLLIDNVRTGTPVTDWSLGAAYDLTTPADRVVIGIAFPFGLYNLSGSSLANESVEIEVRYIELDGGGSPTGSYVVPQFFADGTFNPITITGKVQGELVKQLPLTLYDPATYAPSTLGDAMLCRKTKGYLKRTGLNGNNVGYAIDQILTAFSVEIFYRYVQGLTGGTGQSRAVFGWCNADGTPNAAGNYDLTQDFQGIAVQWADSNASGSIDTVGLELTFGNGTATGRFTALIPSLFTVSNGAQKAGQIVVRISWSGAVAGVSVWHDGALRFTQTYSGEEIRAPSGTDPTFRLGSTNQMTGNASGTIFDQVRIWKRILSPTEIVESWNNGNPVAGLLVGSQAVNLIAQWSMNVADLSGSTGSGTVGDPYHSGTFADDAGNGLPLSIHDLGGGTGGVETQVGLVLDGVGTFDGKSAKYRIEVQRRDLVRDGTIVHDLCMLDHVITVEDASLQYPTRALMGIEIVADDQLNTNRPNVTVPVRGWMTPQWDGNDPIAPTFVKAWSANPAHCAMAVLTEKWGLGSTINLADLDVESFEDWAAWCDELVWDQNEAVVLSVFSYSTWPVGSTLAGLYPQGYLQVKAAFDSIADTMPGHVAVDKLVRFAGSAGGGAPAWVTDIIASTAGYALAEVDVTVDYPGDSVRIPWPTAIGGAPPPSPTSYTLPADAVSLEVLEERSRCDVVMDRRTEQAWDQVLKVFNTGRAIPVKVGDRYRVKWERARDPVQLFNSANIKKGTFRFSLRGAGDSFNAATMEILDRDRDYAREPIALQHDTLRDASLAQNVRERGFTAEGVTRRSQAMRELRFLLNAAHLIRMVIEFETSIEGAFVEVGDVILVSHDLPLWAFSGRCRDDSKDASTIIIDRPFTLAAATVYRVAVRHHQAGDALHWVQISSAAGIYVAGDAITLTAPLNFIPSQDDPWVVGTYTTATKEFQIINAGLTQDCDRIIKAVEYDANVYSETDFPALPSPSTQLDIPGERVTPGAPLFLVGNDGSGVDDDLGRFSKRIDLSWKYSANDMAALGGVAVWIAEEPEDGTIASQWREAALLPARTSTYALMEEDLVLGRTYLIKVQPIGRNGSRQSINRLAPVRVTLEGRSNDIRPPSSIAVVQGGDQVSYIVQQAFSAVDASVELRRGGHILGDRVGTIGVQGDLVGFSENWVQLPTNSAGWGNPPIFARNVFTNQQRSTAYLVEPEMDVSSFDTVLAEGSIEDLGWTAGSPAPVLTNLAVDTTGTPDFLKFSGGNAGTYTTTDIVLSEPRLVHVSLGWLCDQVHPRAWGDDENVVSGAKFVDPELFETGMVVGGVAHGAAPSGGYQEQWGSAFNKNWSWEGPTDALTPDENLFRLDGNVTIRVTMAFSTTTSPGSNFIQYQPGYYFLRSVRFQVALQRADTTYDVRLNRLAYALRARLQDVLDGGDVG